MKESPLTPELAAAGAVHRVEAVPDPVTVEWLTSTNARVERVLRKQYRDDFPEEWEAELRGLQGEDMTSALRRRIFLAHAMRVWREGLRKQGEDPDQDAVRAMDQLLRREPVVVQVCGERVEVTGRSYTAMAQMAAHGLAADRAMTDADRARELYEATRKKALEGGLRARWRLRRRMKRLQHLHRVAYSEAEAHRQAFWGHALTRHGGPAEDPLAEAPEWWDRIGPQEHALLLSCLMQTGPERGAALSEGEKRPKKGDPEGTDRFGALSLLVAWGVKTKVEPAAVLRKDYGQAVAEIVAYSETQPGPDDDDLEYL